MHDGRVTDQMHFARAVVRTGRERCGVDAGSDSVSGSDQMHTAMERGRLNPKNDAV